MTKDTIVTIAVSLLGASAFALTLLTVRREFFPPPTQPSSIVNDWKPFSVEGELSGPATAPAVIVVFSDYECPYCRALEARLFGLRQRYPKRMSVVWRHLPLEGHEFAYPAAVAAVCAAEQGRFEAFHQQLFGKADVLLGARWTEAAVASGVEDTVSFRMCLGSDRAAAVIDRDREAARRLGAVATPTLLVNDALFRGVPPDLERIVEREIEGTGN